LEAFFYAICASFSMKKNIKVTRQKFTGVDLFAGAGGFSLAAQQSGIKVIAAIEMNKVACNTYTRNLIKRKRNPPILFDDDINEIDFKILMKSTALKKRECDVLLGGPPCQGFSTHRINGTGVDDPRNALLFRYFEFVRVLQPKVFVVENVPGLLWKRHEKYLQKFLQEAKKTKYKIHGPTAINARDYGVPQNRKRVFIVGIRDDLDIKLTWPPTPTHFSPTSKEVIELGKRSWEIAASVFSKPLLPNDLNAVHMNHSEEIVNVFRNTPPNGGSRSQSGRILPCHTRHDGHNDVYGRIDPNVPGPTMTTACINPSKGRFVHPTEHHGITARHAARFQTFPDNFIFEGGLMAAGTQIGNAVPIGLGKAVLSHVIAALKRNQKLPTKRKKQMHKHKPISRTPK